MDKLHMRKPGTIDNLQTPQVILLQLVHELFSENKITEEIKVILKGIF